MCVLRSEYHTLNIRTLSLLKQKAVDKVRALSLARKKLVDRARWVDENRQFHLNPSRLFTTRDQLPQQSPTVNETEAFWKDLYENVEPLRETPVLDRFKGYCEEKLTEQNNLHQISREEIQRALREKTNFSDPGVDGIADIWWKSFTFVHELVAERFTELLNGTANRTNVQGVPKVDTNFFILNITPYILIHISKVNLYLSIF